MCSARVPHPPQCDGDPRPACRLSLCPLWLCPTAPWSPVPHTAPHRALPSCPQVGSGTPRGLCWWQQIPIPIPVLVGAGRRSELAAPGTAPSRDGVCRWAAASCKHQMSACARAHWSTSLQHLLPAWLPPRSWGTAYATGLTLQPLCPGCPLSALASSSHLWPVAPQHIWTPPGHTGVEEAVCAPCPGDPAGATVKTGAGGPLPAVACHCPQWPSPLCAP